MSVPDKLCVRVSDLPRYEQPSYPSTFEEEFFNKLLKTLPGLKVMRTERSAYTVYHPNELYARGAIFRTPNEWAIESLMISNKRYGKWNLDHYRSYSGSLETLLPRARKILRKPVPFDMQARRWRPHAVRVEQEKTREEIQRAEEFERAKKLLFRYSDLIESFTPVFVEALRTAHIKDEAVRDALQLLIENSTKRRSRKETHVVYVYLHERGPVPVYSIYEFAAGGRDVTSISQDDMPPLLYERLSVLNTMEPMRDPLAHLGQRVSSDEFLVFAKGEMFGEMFPQLGESA